MNNSLISGKKENYPSASAPGTLNMASPLVGTGLAGGEAEIKEAADGGGGEEGSRRCVWYYGY